MRVACLLLFLCGMVINFEAQTLSNQIVKTPYSVTLRGQAESIELSNVSASGVSLVVKLKLELHNDGTNSVIFLETKPPLLVAAALAKSTDDLVSGNNLASQYTGESIDTSPEWIALRECLKQPFPPPDKVRVLMPNESWWIEGSVSIALPTESGKASFYPKRETWERVQELSTIWLRIAYQSWSLNLEPESNDRTKKAFGYKLQKRWKSVGLLSLDDVRSEPIMLDLKKVQSSKLPASHLSRYTQ